MRKNDPTVTPEWQQYQDGIDYNTRINLYDNVNRNERMYARRPVERSHIQRPAYACI